MVSNQLSIYSMLTFIYHIYLVMPASPHFPDGVPLPMVKWVKSFLSNREAAICLDGRTSDSRPVKNGIPQGSPISPALSIVYASPVCEEFQTRLATRYVHRAPPGTKITPTTLASYIDDVNLYTYILNQSHTERDRPMARFHNCPPHPNWPGSLD